MKVKSVFLISSFVLLGILILITSSCKKDNNTNNNSFEYYFNYDGKSYQLNKGILISYGPIGQISYEFDLCLYSGVTIINVDSILGKGCYIVINLRSNATTLSPGSYPMVDSGYASFTSGGGKFVTNWDSALEDQQFIYIKSGLNEVISVSGDQIEISFDLVSTEGKNVSGYYKGKVQPF